MAGVKLFRTALNGFNKDDVLAYIEDLNNNMREMEKNYKRRILDLESQTPDETELNKADEEIVTASLELENKISQLEKERDELSNRISEMEQKEKEAKPPAFEGVPVVSGGSEDAAKVREEYEARLSQLLTGFEQLMSEKREEYEKLLAIKQAECEAKINALTMDNEILKKTVDIPEERVIEKDKTKSEKDNIFDINRLNAQAAEEKDLMSTQISEGKVMNAQAGEEKTIFNAQTDEGETLKEYETLRDELLSVKEELKSARELSDFMETKANDLETKLAQSQNGIISLVNTVSDYESKIKEYEEQIGKIKTQTDAVAYTPSINASLPSVGVNKADIDGRIRELENQIADDKQRIILLTDKAKLYEEIKAHVSQIISDARNDADKILAEATEKAKKLRAAVNESISLARERMKTMRARVGESSEGLVSATSKMADMFEMIIDSIELTDNQLINLMDSEQSASYSKDINLDYYKEKYNNQEQ